MAFEIAWLESARKELDAEIEYVYSEFGEDSARRARTKIKEAVDPLDTFPNSGMRCEGDGGQAPVPTLKISILHNYSLIAA